MTEHPDWHAARNVLCVRLDGLGDLLMTSPAIRALKHAHANRKITLLTSPAGAEAAALMPEVDDVLIYDAPWMKATHPRHHSRPDIALIDRLRQRHDAAAIFTVFSQSALPAALLCFLADIPLRLAHCRENPYQLLTHWAPDQEPEQGIRHEVRRQLDLVAGVGCTVRDERIRIHVPKEAEQRITNLLERIGI
jgi:ADP-heptose:LPS heptosyltransferase